MHCSKVSQNTGIWNECHPSLHVHINNQSKKGDGQQSQNDKSKRNTQQDHGKRIRR